MSKGALTSLLAAVVSCAALGIAWAALRADRGDDSERLAQALGKLERRLADLEAGSDADRLDDLERRFHALSDDLTLSPRSGLRVSGAGALPVAEPGAKDSPSQSPPSDTQADDGAGDGFPDLSDADPYGISVPPETERQVRAIYGRIQDEERARRRERETERREDSVRDRVDELASELNLNTPQKTAVERILLDESRKRAELFAQGDGDARGRERRRDRSPRDFGDEMRRIYQERDAALQTVLDFDQMKRFNETDRRRNRSWGGGPPGETGG